MEGNSSSISIERKKISILEKNSIFLLSSIVLGRGAHRKREESNVKKRTKRNHRKPVSTAVKMTEMNETRRKE